VESKPKILIIDDEDVVLDSCTKILEGSNYHIAAAKNGALGLKLFHEVQPDLVFVDLKMPGITGIEVLEKIFASDPTMVTIVITGYATVSSAVEAMKIGAYDFLPKPFTPDEFRLITQRGLEKRRLVLEALSLRREKEMLREHFAAIVSHELKAPVGAVQQNLFVLAQELSSQLTEDQKARLDRMRSSIDALLRLIHTWLRVYSTDIEKIADNFEPTSVGSTLSKAIESVQSQATRKDVEILVTVEDNLRPVLGDEGTLAEALVNIISNAIKYSRMSSQVLVKAEAKDDDIFITISDSGVGISKEDLPYIFEGFYGSKPGAAGERGSGLGLAITRQIIEAHRGSISVESELGKGSTFVVCLPVHTTESQDHPNLAKNAMTELKGDTE
jgi:two-component system sensor histidine kinase/response regulator